MVRIEESVTIERPIEEVFNYLTTIERQPEWVTSMQRSTLTSDGPVGEGTTFRQTVKLVGRTIDADMTVTAYQPPHRYEFEGRSGPMQARIRFDLTPEGNGTRIVQTLDGEAEGVFKLADPILARTVGKQFQADLETLKSLLESGVAAETAGT